MALLGLSAKTLHLKLLVSSSDFELPGKQLQDWLVLNLHHLPLVSRLYFRERFLQLGSLLQSGTLDYLSQALLENLRYFEE